MGLFDKLKDGAAAAAEQSKKAAEQAKKQIYLQNSKIKTKRPLPSQLCR